MNERVGEGEEDEAERESAALFNGCQKAGWLLTETLALCRLMLQRDPVVYSRLTMDNG